MQALCFLLLLSAAGELLVSAAPSTENEPQVKQDSLDKIEEIIEKEITDHVVRAYLGVAPQFPAVSCKQIFELKPSYDSGYYWIEGPSGAEGVYCEMKGEFEERGGWMRIANTDMTDLRSQCPPGLVYDEVEDKRLCRRYSGAIVPGCVSAIFPAHAVQYSKVCGKVIGYQYFSPNAFGPAGVNPNISQIYVDGVSITHGPGIDRQHIWTFAAARDEVHQIGSHTRCPCMDFSRSFTGIIPSFVGNDYYCETGSRTYREERYYFDDPLWDGEGCEGQDMCCDRGGPWFCKELAANTTDDVELRICLNGPTEDIVLEKIKLYIQ